jgi:hypothetical protein
VWPHLIGIHNLIVEADADSLAITAPSFLIQHPCFDADAMDTSDLADLAHMMDMPDLVDVVDAIDATE